MIAGTDELLFGGFGTLLFFVLYSMLFLWLCYRNGRRPPWWAGHAGMAAVSVLGFATMLLLIWPAQEIGLIHP